MAKDYVFTPPPNWPAPPRGWTPPPGWTPDPEWGPAPEGWQFWTQEEVSRPWIAKHPVATGIGATAVVLGGVIGITAFASGPDKPAPITAAATSSADLTASQDGATGPTALTESTLTSTSDSPTSPTDSPTDTSPSPTSRTSTTTTSAPSTTSPTSTPSPSRTVRVYLSCRGLNRDHAHGVGLPGAVDFPHPFGRPPVTNFDVNARLYQANQGLDRDGDGIACER
jgi:hypothetical protein